jgi:hypothetical protein
MKRSLGWFVLLLMPLATSAVEGGQVMYVGGTVETLTGGVSGRLDASSQRVLNFEYSGGKLAIPFEMIDQRPGTPTLPWQTISQALSSRP